MLLNDPSNLQKIGYKKGINNMEKEKSKNTKIKVKENSNGNTNENTNKNDENNDGNDGHLFAQGGRIIVLSSSRYQTM